MIRTPKPTNFESFFEIYTKYFKITNKAINFEDQNSIPTLKAINFQQNSTPILSQNEYGSRRNFRGVRSCVIVQ